ncbi:PEGA domain-containing protein [Lachnospiraceae bacterium NSJ-143]|nr:PEGA domain-containing protein [Lachnospiraceae bacterium NSJ-143]
MGNYNFENDDKDFGETRRLDTIHKEVHKIEKNLKNGVSAVKTGPSGENRVFGIKISTAVVIIILCAAFILTGCYVLFKMIGSSGAQPQDIKSKGENGNTALLQNGNDDSSISCGVITEKGTKNMIVLSVSTGEKRQVEISNSTVITGANGGKISLKDLVRGDIVSVRFSAEGEAEQIRFPEEAWHYTDVSGVNIDAAAMTAELDGKYFSYDNETIFTYQGENIYPGDIEECDLITLYGIGGNLLSAKVEKYHGYIVLKNAEEIEDMAVVVDFGEPQDASNYIIPVSEGKHTIVVSGSNIDEYMSEVEVGEKERLEVDLSKASEASRIILNVNVPEYNVTINGIAYPKNTTEAAVSRGMYDIVITAEGYKEFSAKADCTKDDAHIDVKLEKSAGQAAVQPNSGTKPAEANGGKSGEGAVQGSLTVFTEPGWAKIYVDGNYVGVAPVMVKLDYGKHNIKAKDDSGVVEEKDINIDGPDKTVKIEF